MIILSKMATENKIYFWIAEDEETTSKIFNLKIICGKYKEFDDKDENYLKDCTLDKLSKFIKENKPIAPDSEYKSLHVNICFPLNNQYAFLKESISMLITEMDVTGFIFDFDGYYYYDDIDEYIDFIKYYISDSVCKFIKHVEIQSYDISYDNYQLTDFMNSKFKNLVELNSKKLDNCKLLLVRYTNLTEISKFNDDNIIKALINYNKNIKKSLLYMCVQRVKNESPINVEDENEKHIKNKEKLLAC